MPFRTIRRALGSDLGGALDDDLTRLGVDLGCAPRGAVTAEDLEGLPEAARRYLGFVGALDRPKVTSIRARFTGRFRMGRDKPWMPCVAEQYDRVDPVARLFRMRLVMARAVPVVALDSYVGGVGAMHGSLLGLIPVADAEGPEMDLGELTTWVNDAILFAPSLLLGPATTWSSDDRHHVDVAFTDHDLTSHARVTIDERGAPVAFESRDRWAALPSGLVRATWRTPVPAWSSDSWQLPVGASAVWELDDGPFAYVEGGLDPATLEVDGVRR